MVTYCKTPAQADAEKAEWLFTAVGRSLPNQYGNQCSAAMQSYVTTMLGRPWTQTLGYGNAIAHIDNASSVYFEKIWNDPTNPNQLPRVGDIAVYRGAAPLWDGRYYGHTGAVLSFTAAAQTLVQQDGAAEPTKLFPDGYRYSIKPAHKDTFAYVGDPRVGDIRGWLRLRWQKVVYTGADTRGYGASSTATPQPTPAAPTTTNLHGVDYSNHQPDIDPSRIATDFIGVLATDGVYRWTLPNGTKIDKSPTLDAQMAAAQRKTKRTMVYHFARVGQSDSTTQANRFLAAAKKHIDAGAVPVLDWEKDAWNHRADWARAWIEHVEKATGKQVWVYQRLAAAAHPSWGTFRRPMWLSWYASKARLNGYQPTLKPPAVPGWHVVLWQYTDNGWLPGYNGPLDLNMSFGDPWNRAGGMGSTASTTDPLEEIMGWFKNKKDFLDSVALAVIDYKFSDNGRGPTGKKQWVWLGKVLSEWNELLKRVDQLEQTTRDVPAKALDYGVTRRGQGPLAGKQVNLATVLAYEQDNQVTDRAVAQQILAQQELILQHLGITTTENGA